MEVSRLGNLGACPNVLEINGRFVQTDLLFSGPRQLQDDRQSTGKCGYSETASCFLVPRPQCGPFRPARGVRGCCLGASVRE